MSFHYACMPHEQHGSILQEQVLSARIKSACVIESHLNLCYNQGEQDQRISEDVSIYVQISPCLSSKLIIPPLIFSLVSIILFQTELLFAFLKNLQYAFPSSPLHQFFPNHTLSPILPFIAFLPQQSASHYSVGILHQSSW